ncbi:MAG: restriction endonuclease [Propionibacteriaceae bacterium]|jgi:restriction system protein|nr:restriction endonuclease [Propionibacteriaceae bacterium]
MPISTHNVSRSSRFAPGGAQIDDCEAESLKRQDIEEHFRMRWAATSVADILQAFSNHPSDFESFCADLLRRQGYHADVTPPTRDGGYDLVLVDPSGRSMIAECKCYATSCPIGRTLLQKLVGANRTVGASGLMFITTSRYSAEARAYAQVVGMVTIDGPQLVSMAQRVQAGFGGSPASRVPHLKSVNPRFQVELTDLEFLECLPEDMRHLYA